MGRKGIQVISHKLCHGMINNIVSPAPPTKLHLGIRLLTIYHGCNVTESLHLTSLPFSRSFPSWLFFNFFCKSPPYLLHHEYSVTCLGSQSIWTKSADMVKFRKVFCIRFVLLCTFLTHASWNFHSSLKPCPGLLCYPWFKGHMIRSWLMWL